MASPTDGDRRTAVSLRPLGSPLPLGLAGLAVATFLYAGFQLGWIAQSERTVVGALILVAGVRFGLGGVYELGAGEGWQDASAGTGLALAALAFYAAFAMQLEDACGKTVAPLGRRGAGEQAMAGSLDDQAAGVEHEAGVRKRL